MATDYTTRDLLRCPCGQGVVTLTSTSPDHLWARESQTTYSATIECIACQEEFAVHQVSSNSRPQIVYRDELEAKEAIREEYWAADTAIQQSDQAKRLRPNIVVAVDNESSKAARHRKLKRFGLALESYGTYLKRPYGGEEAIRHIRGRALAHVGSTTSLSSDDKEYFTQAFDALQKLREAEEAIRLREVKLSGQSGRQGENSETPIKSDSA